LTRAALPPDATGPPDRTRAVIFDNDGVLVDSEPLHRIAWERVFRPRGAVVSEDDYAWSIGRRDLTFAGLIADRFRLRDSAEALRDEKRRHYLKLLREESRTFGGLPELVRALARTHRLGIASSAIREAIDTVIERFGLDGLFEAVVSQEEVADHKPHPQPYRLCAERLGVAPARCVAIEDSVSGVRSAKAAGMRAIGFTSTFPGDALREADAVIGSMSDGPAILDLVDSLVERPDGGYA